MAYRFKPGRPIDSEVRRIVDKQFDLALDMMRGVGSRTRDKTTHRSRRHIKKARALIRLVRPLLGDWYRPANRRLRAASRLLAPIADGESIVDALAHMGVEVAVRALGPAERPVDVDTEAWGLAVG